MFVTTIEFVVDEGKKELEGMLKAAENVEEFDIADLDDNDPYFMLEGWNIDPLEIALNEANEVVTPSLSYTDFAVPKSVKRGQEFNISITVINTANSGKCFEKLLLTCKNKVKD